MCQVPNRYRSALESRAADRSGTDEQRADPAVTTVGPKIHTAVRKVTPRLPEWRENVIRGIAVIALLYATYWIWWRWTNTINTEPRAIVPSLLLIIAETWAYINMCLFVFLVWRLKERDPGPAPVGRRVDVFITCYNEPLEVLRRTAIGARAIKYPHRTYMLDDGKRDEVQGDGRRAGHRLHPPRREREREGGESQLRARA